MAVITIGSTTRAWYEASTTSLWSAQCAVDTGSALYTVVLDTGTARLRVYKADSRTAPTAFTEQDSATTRSVVSSLAPYSATLDTTNRYIDIACFTAATTVTHYRYDTQTDTWITGRGNATTVASQIGNLRIITRSNDTHVIAFTSSADDADLGMATWGGASWSVNASSLVAVNSTLQARIVASAVDSADRYHWIFYDGTNGDVTWRGGNGAIDLEMTGPANTAANAGAVYTPYDDGGTPKLLAAYTDGGGLIDARELTLGADAAAGGMSAIATVETTAANVGARTPVATAKVGTTWYVAWWSDANSGTAYYASATSLAGTWTRTAWKTGVSRLVQIVPVGDALLGVYQASATQVAVDWIVEPASTGPTSATFDTTTATFSAPALDATGGSAATFDAATATATSTAIEATVGSAVVDATATFDPPTAASIAPNLTATAGSAATLDVTSTTATTAALTATAGASGDLAATTTTALAPDVAALAGALGDFAASTSTTMAPDVTAIAGSSGDLPVTTTTALAPDATSTGGADAALPATLATATAEPLDAGITGPPVTVLLAPTTATTIAPDMDAAAGASVDLAVVVSTATAHDLAARGGSTAAFGTATLATDAPAMAVLAAAYVSLAPTTATAETYPLTATAGALAELVASTVTGSAVAVTVRERFTVYYPWPGTVTFTPVTANVTALLSGTASMQATVAPTASPVTAALVPIAGPTMQLTTTTAPSATLAPAAAPTMTLAATAAPTITVTFVPDPPETVTMIPGPRMTLAPVQVPAATFTVLSLPVASTTALPGPVAVTAPVPDAPAFAVTPVLVEA